MSHLHPAIAAALAPFAPAGSSVHEDAQHEEARRLAADRQLNAMKNSGELLRMEIDRAHRAELDAGLHN